MNKFSTPVRDWFTETFHRPTPVQAQGWNHIAAGRHVLLTAPTGSGKTLAAFLASINTLSQLPADAAPGIRTVYISPLKALVYDVERNLRAPLAGIQRFANRGATPLRTLRVDVRTGDTPQQERQRQLKNPAEILVTTPESLFLMLGSRAREHFRTVTTIIVDEIHALAPTKRGAHLALSLERLCQETEIDPQRVGLSATVRPRDEIARFLGGDRAVEIVDATTPPNLDIRITVPVPDMENVSTPAVAPTGGGSILGEMYAREVGTPRVQRGIWPAMYPELLALIRANRSTIIFVNSRGLCERLCQHLNELAGEELVRAHHGSVSHEQRAQIEDGLKRGTLPAIVATSSLELGIDMGAVDLVVLVESPGSVARGLQRVGRAGHQVGAASVGRLFPKFRGDLLECAVIAQRMQRGELEALSVPRNPLDVLAQQIVAMCTVSPRTVDELANLCRRAHPYRELSDGVLQSVLEMLAGNFPSSDFADLSPLLRWDRSTDVLSPRRGAALLSRMNAGTIPDRGNYAVQLGADGPRLGELDEEMVFESKAGDNIMLGASTWHVEQITHDRVIVSPAPGEPGRLPFWHGEGPGRPVELGMAIGAFTRRIAALDPSQAVETLLAESPMDRFAAQNLVAYIDEQRQHTGTVPTDRSITIERFRDEMGDWRVCILTPFGSRIHAPWAMALQRLLGEGSGFEIQVMYTDDGIVVRFADVEDPPEIDSLIPDPEEVETLVTEQLGDTALFAGLFRENAARSLLLPRRRADRRNPLWAQRIKSQNLLATVRQHPRFPMVLETYRQALRDVFDLDGLKALLRRVRSREVAVVDVETHSASPFARSLVFAYVAAYIYEQDTPLAERKAQALTLDRNLLAELLGQAELRELIDPQVLAELEEELQALAGDRKARDADQLHDLLRRLGDLSPDELRQRCSQEPAPWLETLQQQRRAILVPVGAEPRWIAAEDAGLYRDALGVSPPSGLPDSFLGPVDQPLEQLLRRFARTRGPFTTTHAARRFQLLPAQAEPLLRLLENQDLLIHGELRPGGAELDWCDREVLRRLKSRTLARLRHQVAPVDAGALASFLPQWQDIGSERRGFDRLDEVVGQLQGLPLPWSVLSTVVLPSRIADFSQDSLDMLAATGRVVWVGSAPIGNSDGRITLYRRDQVAHLLDTAANPCPDGPLHHTLLEQLRQRGASFYMELHTAALSAHPNLDAADFEHALWDLVWAGQITNDTFAPLRSLGYAARARRTSGRAVAGGRWSLVNELSSPSIPDTARAVARTRMLLNRYGIVSREAAVAENIPGGFGPLYRVLKTMEESGRVRRGYFIEGLSGAQFAVPGAVDRLRAAQPDNGTDTGQADEQARLIAAMDPANPYGALLPWPVTDAADATRPRRAAGAWLVTVAGKPVVYVGAGARRLLTFSDTCRDSDMLASAFRCLHRLPRRGSRKLLVIEQINGLPVRETSYYALLKQLGFQSDYRGVLPAVSY